MNVFGVRLKESYPEIQARVCLIGPDEAKELLKFNTRNRRPSETVILKYLREVEADEWVVTATGIGFCEDGSLTDGQQRLMCIARGTKTVPILVVTGLPKRAQLKTDRQRRRDLADSLTLSGAECKRAEMHIANTLTWLSSNQSTKSDSDIINTLEVHRDAIRAIVGGLKSGQRVLAGARAALTLAYEIHGQLVLEFLENIQSDLHSRHDDPCYRLWAWMRENPAGGYVMLRQYYRKTIFAFNAWAQKQYVTRLGESDSIIEAKEVTRQPKDAPRPKKAA